MKGTAVDSNGVHVVSTFQAYLGASSNFNLTATKLNKETADTNIYSLVVDIPAFQEYEYKFVNGNKSYQIEYVPYDARVLYHNIDNRWFWLDSTKNDTTNLGAVYYEGTRSKISFIEQFF